MSLSLSVLERIDRVGVSVHAGEGAKATRELGQVLTEARIAALVRALRAVKADTKSLELQKEFFDRVDKVGR